MATSLKLRRGTTAQHASFTGSAAEVTVDTDKNTVVVHNGSTAGGIPLAKETNPALNGNVTTTGLNFDSNTFVIDATNNRVGVGTSSPASRLAITETSTTAGAADIVRINTASGGNFNISCSDLSASVPSWTIQTGSSEPLIFSQSTTERMRIDSSGNMGIGTSSPLRTLDIVQKTNDTTPVLLLRGYTTGVDGARTTQISSVSSDANNWANIQTNAHQFIWSYQGGTERMRLDASGNVGIGTSSPQARLVSAGSSSTVFKALILRNADGTVGSSATIDFEASTGTQGDESSMAGRIAGVRTGSGTSGALTFSTTNSGVLGERMRIDSSGNLLVSLNGTLYVGKTAEDGTQRGFLATSGSQNSYAFVTNDIASGGYTLGLNRQVSDGTLIEFRQANSAEGSVSVSGTTVSYNGGHLSRYAQTIVAKDDSLLKGTVLSNLDEMNVYVDVDGNTAENEQLNKVKVSDVEGDVNVAGVFVNWYLDEAHNVDEINMAMTGDMIIRIAQGVTVNRGDLLMSAGDGTAKPQGDDIVRGKTIAKVTSTRVTCTYADGSYCVPCVLMAC